MCAALQLSEQSGGLGANGESMAADSEGAQATGSDVVTSSSGSSAARGVGAGRQAGASGRADKRATDADVGQVCHGCQPSLSYD